MNVFNLTVFISKKLLYFYIVIILIICLIFKTAIMKKSINVIIAPSDLLNSQLNDIIGSDCNKCKNGEVTVVYKKVLVAEKQISTLSAW